MCHALAALTGEHLRGRDDEPVSRLEHHLKQYTRRNDSDFFIHKDLRGFLSRELDFYLKNEVLNLDNLEAAGEQAADGWFQQMRLIKSVGGGIIDFLAQIEGFQKMLLGEAQVRRGHPVLRHDGERPIRLRTRRLSTTRPSGRSGKTSWA